MRAELDKEEYKTHQIFSDQKMEYLMKYEAHRLFMEWIDAKEITFDGKTFKNCLLLVRPLESYVIWDSETAKYMGFDFNEEIKKQFQEHKDKYAASLESL